MLKFCTRSYLNVSARGATCESDCQAGFAKCHSSVMTVNVIVLQSESHFWRNLYCLSEVFRNSSFLEWNCWHTSRNLESFKCYQILLCDSTMSRSVRMLFDIHSQGSLLQLYTQGHLQLLMIKCYSIECKIQCTVLYSGWKVLIIHSEISEESFYSVGLSTSFYFVDLCKWFENVCTETLPHSVSRHEIITDVIAEEARKCIVCCLAWREKLAFGQTHLPIRSIMNRDDKSS